MYCQRRTVAQHADVGKWTNGPGTKAGTHGRQEKVSPGMGSANSKLVKSLDKGCDLVLQAHLRIENCIEPLGQPSRFQEHQTNARQGSELDECCINVQ